MPLLQRSDNTEHVDTSCLFVAAAAFDLLTLWGTWPLPLSRIDDRMFWNAALARHDVHAFSGALTTAYEASHVAFYDAIGEPAPAGVRGNLDLPGLFAWYAGLRASTRKRLDADFGFPIGGLLDRLAGQDIAPADSHAASGAAGNSSTPPRHSPPRPKIE